MSHMTSSVPDWLDRPLEIENGRILESDLPFYTLDLENIYLLSPSDDFFIQKAQKECLKIIKNGSKVIGLDCEWDWFNQNQVNLIQISSSEGNLLLHNFPRLPPAFLKILESDEIKKVGVNIQMDLDKIAGHYNVKVNGALDLREWLGTDGSLSFLSSKYLKRKIEKKDSIRRSKWSNQNLTEAQIIYAAIDAKVSFDLYFCK